MIRFMVFSRRLQLVCLLVSSLVTIHCSVPRVQPLNWDFFRLQSHNLSYESFHKGKVPSMRQWDSIDKTGHFSVMSLHVDHHFESNWHIPSLHDEINGGLNSSDRDPHHGKRPYACTLRFFGVALESTLKGFENGGSGYLTIAFTRSNGKNIYHGFDKAEAHKLHCFYTTSQGTASDFKDTPKTLAIAVVCPVSLDEEIGAYEHGERHMEAGRYCNPIALRVVDGRLHLRPSTHTPSLPPQTEGVDNKEIVGEFFSNPAKDRALAVETMKNDGHYRKHAVCTAMTFTNKFTGPMLYMFTVYYQLLGWRVIIYDRFGSHYNFIQDLLHLPGIDYYPYTLYELAQPSKYNLQYLRKQGTDLKSFYKTEANWGYTSKKLADTADQDADKTKTYDYARLEYSDLHTMLFLDTDEFFFCPQASQNISAQRHYQMLLHDEFHARGVEEMRYVRLAYSGMGPPELSSNHTVRSKVDLTNHTGHCMLEAYEKRCMPCLLQCWSAGISFDNFVKHADLASICPFHYNHYACDGMKGGSRDHSPRRCRCKVGFDMQNGFTFHAVLDRCHLMHFNDNRYRVQYLRQGHHHQLGDLTVPNPLYHLLLRRDGAGSSPAANGPLVGGI